MTNFFGLVALLKVFENFEDERDAFEGVAESQEAHRPNHDHCGVSGFEECFDDQNGHEGTKD